MSTNLSGASIEMILFANGELQTDINQWRCSPNTAQRVCGNGAVHMEREREREME